VTESGQAASRGGSRGGEQERLESGGYARREVPIDPLTAADASLELGLAPGFGPLFSALLAPRQFRVRKLALEYVAPERLTQSVTYSAKVGASLEGGAALELSLLIARGAFLCVRGQAVVEFAPGSEARGARSGSANGLNGSSAHGREKEKHG
jgi:hypothetical protein